MHLCIPVKVGMPTWDKGCYVDIWHTVLMGIKTGVFPAIDMLEMADAGGIPPCIIVKK